MAAIDSGVSQADFANLLKFGAPPAETNRVLNVVRIHLGMDVAFISRFGDVARVLDHVVGGEGCPLVPGQSIPLEEGYCLKIIRGELPQLIPDTAQVPATQDIPATHLIPIGAHLSVPIRLENGELYGTLCCFNRKPIPSLGPEDLRLLRVLSDVLAANIDRAREEEAALYAKHSQIQGLIANAAVNTVYQPIYTIASGRLQGFECLSRFPTMSPPDPEPWFKNARAVGLLDALQMHAIEIALAPALADRSDIRLNINGSPELIVSGKLMALLKSTGFRHVTVEITEHDEILEYAPVIDAVAELRSQGAKLAIDDAGAGISSMRHILLLKPDVVKLDASIVRGVDHDTARQSLIHGLVRFCHHLGSTVTAEGVETRAELLALGELHVDQAQGMYLGVPRSLDDVLARSGAGVEQLTEVLRPHRQPDTGD
ncbi:MAG: EAL domain-containing protein [Rhodocyclaceae bacterium]